MLNIPIIKGIPEDKSSLGLLTYAICSDGLYLIKKVGFGFITLKLDKIPGVPEGKEEVSPLVRKIPMDAYFKSLDFFRYIEKYIAKGKALEVFTLVLYNKTEDKYKLYVPLQKVSAGSVSYDVQRIKELFPGYIIVLDIHSHTSNMSAFFSGTDDADDCRDRFSMVIGHINKIFPSHVLRFSTMKRKIDFTIDDIFSDSDEFLDFNIEESAKHVIPITSKDYTNRCGLGQNGYSDFRKDYDTKGRYGLLKDLLLTSKKDFTIRELMGEDW